MTIKLTSLKADLDRESRGDWIEIPDLPGVSLKVSSQHLPAYKIARDMLHKRLQRKYKGKDVPDDVIISEMGKLYAAHILHDWKGFDEEYSAEAALRILSDPAYRLIISAVSWASERVADVDVQFVEDEVKNSEKRSAAA